VLAAAEIIEKITSGKAIPAPKETNVRTFAIKSVITIVLEKRIAINTGLQGTTIDPKKNPKKNADFRGFFDIGARNFGKYFPRSMLKISIRLAIPKITNAIGEMIPTTLFSDSCRIVMNISPSKNMKVITPTATNNPNKKIVFLELFPEKAFDKKARNPGYSGRTHAAVKGVNNPRTKAVANSAKKSII
jgi:hypothetical protein